MPTRRTAWCDPFHLATLPVALILLVGGCNPPTSQFTVSIRCPDQEAPIGEDVALQAQASDNGATVTLTASGGALIDNGNGTGSLTSDSTGWITVTATAISWDGVQTATDSCGVQFSEGSGRPECTTDADCDDGLFCNGEEVCVGGHCSPGRSPCQS